MNNLSNWYTRATPLYGFIRSCNSTELDKKVLDLGAGGPQPPLYLFHLDGYETAGIDISDRAVNRANEFCKNQGIDLNITKGDMRKLDFDDGSFSFVYSFNTIMHLTKKDTAKAMKEIERVLVPGGLVYVNFTSDDSQIGDRGEEISEGEFLVPIGGGETALHSFYMDDEADKYFDSIEIISKEKRLFSRYVNGEPSFTSGYIDYIARKK